MVRNMLLVAFLVIDLFRLSFIALPINKWALKQGWESEWDMWVVGRDSFTLNCKVQDFGPILKIFAIS